MSSIKCTGCGYFTDARNDRGRCPLCADRDARETAAASVRSMNEMRAQQQAGYQGLQLQGQTGRAEQSAVARVQAQQEACASLQLGGYATAMRMIDDAIEAHIVGLGSIRIDGRLLRTMRYTGKPELLIDAMANEVGALLRENPPAPDLNVVARAIFDYDPRVVDFCMKVADHDSPNGERDVERWRRAKDIAYARDEQGWRGEANRLAGYIHHRLRDGKP